MRSAPLVLDAEELEFESAALDGRKLAAGDYALDDAHLTIAKRAVALRPRDSLQDPAAQEHHLMGLYAAESGFFTQCEAEGFRRITYFVDRPDVMAKYTVTIHADRGNIPCCCRTETASRGGEESGGRHYAQVARSLPQALLSLRHGRGEARQARGRLRHPLRAAREARDLRRPGKARPVRLRHGGAQARHEMGRGRLRARSGPRQLLHRRGRRFQHGRDGKQGAQRLQHQVRARASRYRDRRRLSSPSTG